MQNSVHIELSVNCRTENCSYFCTQISQAADENCYIIMASLDLNMALDLVNLELLIRRLKIIGLPNDQGPISLTLTPALKMPNYGV